MLSFHRQTPSLTEKTPLLPLVHSGQVHGNRGPTSTRRFEPERRQGFSGYVSPPFVGQQFQLLMPHRPIVGKLAVDCQLPHKHASTMHMRGLSSDMSAARIAA